MLKKSILLILSILFFVKCNDSSGGNSRREKINAEKTRLNFYLEIKNDLDSRFNFIVEYNSSLIKEKSDLDQEIQKIDFQIKTLNDLNKVSEIQKSINDLKIRVDKYEIEIEENKPSIFSLEELEKRKAKLDKRAEKFTFDFELSQLKYFIEGQISNIKTQGNRGLVIQDLVNKLKLELDKYENLIQEKELEKEKELETQKARLTALLEVQIKRKNELDKEFEIYLINSSYDEVI